MSVTWKKTCHSNLNLNCKQWQSLLFWSLTIQHQVSICCCGRRHKLSKKQGCKSHVFFPLMSVQYWSDILQPHTDFSTQRLFNVASLHCPDSMNYVLSCRNWLQGWTSLPTPAFRTIPSGPTSSSGKPLSTARSRVRSEPFILTPQGRKGASLQDQR